MAVPQPPSTENPFPLRMDDSLAMSEDYNAHVQLNSRSTASMSTIAPDIAETVPENAVPPKPVVMATQALLQSACRRKRLSSSGTKQQLEKRLEDIGVNTALQVRSKYTIARERFTKSGQGENDVFDTFTDGDDTLSYMHCVFYGLPALEAVVRALPEGFGVEAGLEEISQARSASQDLSRRNKKRKTQLDNSIAEGLRDVARAVTAPVEININKKPESVTTGKFHEFDMSDRIAGTVTKLMTLEDTIRSNLRQATLDQDKEYIEELRGRLTNVQRRIDRALME